MTDSPKIVEVDGNLSKEDIEAWQRIFNDPYHVVHKVLAFCLAKGQGLTYNALMSANLDEPEGIQQAMRQQGFMSGVQFIQKTLVELSAPKTEEEEDDGTGTERTDDGV